MKNIFLIIFITVSFSQVNHPYPPLDLVSIPTSGTLPKGTFTIETLLTKNGGMVPKLLVGLNDNFSIGMSFVYKILLERINLKVINKLLKFKLSIEFLKRLYLRLPF